jgi:predicted Fe-Mo cluster-binding NifX family protein
MKICIPSRDDRGLESEVHDHFGSAPWFIVVDTEHGTATSLRNPACHAQRGSCHHVDLLQEQGVAAVISAGMGRRALEGLNQAGIKVFSAMVGRVGDLVKAVEGGKARLLDLDETCGGPGPRGWGMGRGHGAGGGCGHGHGQDHGHGHGRGHSHGSRHGHEHETMDGGELGGH